MEIFVYATWTHTDLRIEYLLFPPPVHKGGPSPKIPSYPEHYRYVLISYSRIVGSLRS